MDWKPLLENKKLLIFHAVVLTSALVTIPFSYFLNFGWIRGIFAPVFAIYFILFTTFNFSYLLFLWIAPWRMVPLFWLSCLTYLAGNLLLPDMADSGNPYACFGQIEIVGPEPNLTYYATLLGIGNVAIGILQALQLAIDLTLKFRKRHPPTSDPSATHPAPVLPSN